MMYSLKMRLKADKKLERSDYLGPVLHGALMEMLPEAYKSDSQRTDYRSAQNCFGDFFEL